MKGRAARWATGARSLAIALVALAPFAPPSHREGEERSVVYVVDRSQSVALPDRAPAQAFVAKAIEEGAKRDTKVGVVSFAGRPRLVRPVDADRHAVGEAPPALDLDAGLEAGPGSDVGAAIRLAASALPTAGERRIVLLSDGRATRGDAAEEVRRARADGIVVDTVPVGSTEPDAPRIARLFAKEPRVNEGESASLVAELHGPPKQDVHVQWARDGKPIGAPVTGTFDERGIVEVSTTDDKPGPGVHVYEARVTDGTAPSFGRQAQAAVSVSGKPLAIVVTPDGDCPKILADALDRAEITKDVVNATSWSPDPVALSAADLVILNDVPLARGADAQASAGLSPKAQEVIVDYVRDRGGGAIVTGGSFGFAPEYASSPLSRMLPVEIEDQGDAQDPRVAMAIMLDRSGSMAAMAGAHTKLELAVEASLASASALRPDDILAIASVDERTNWNNPLGPVTKLDDHKASVRAIDAGGGGIYVYTALADAYRVLKGVTAGIRHVLLFSDTDDSEEQFKDCPFAPCPEGAIRAEHIAQQAKKAGITTSVVGIGLASDHDTEFLVRLAAAGGGRFYLTARASDLRRIFIAETRIAARSNLRDEATAVRIAGAHPILEGVDTSKVPPVSGIVEAQKRATADTPIVTHDDKPVLAAWRYGLGQVVALTTDLRSDWKGSWADWKGAGQVLRQAARFSVRRRAVSGAEASMVVGDRSLSLSMEVAEGLGDASQPASVEAFAASSDGKLVPVPVTLERVAPGRWIGRGETNGASLVVARVRSKSGGLVTETVGQHDASTELAGLGPDERALRELARSGDGVFAPKVEETLRQGGPRGREPIASWPFVLVLAAVVVCIDLWLRRLPEPRPRRAAPKAAAAPAPAPPPAEEPAKEEERRAA